MAKAITGTMECWNPIATCMAGHYHDILAMREHIGNALCHEESYCQQLTIKWQICVVVDDV